MKTYKRLTYDERIQIQTFLRQGVKPYKIAELLGFENSSIYREIKRGTVNGRYDATHSHKRCLESKNTLGRKGVLKLNPDLAKYISYLIRDQKLSPKRIVEKLKKEKYPNCPASYTTIYSAIDAGLIPDVTRETLRHKETHMFSNRLLKIPSWICEELDLKDGEVLNIDVENRKIIVKKLDKKDI